MHWNESLPVPGNGSTAPALGPTPDHIRMSVAAGHLPRPQSPYGAATGLVGAAHTAHMPWVSFLSACCFCSFPESWKVHQTTASGARVMPG